MAVKCRRTGRFLTFLVGLLVACGGAAPAAVLAASPADPVRDLYRGDFSRALSGYEALGKEATERTDEGLVPLDEGWVRRMQAVDALLTPHERTFFPMMYRPWTRESAVFTNLEGARMWLWSVRDALKDGADGVESIDVSGGRVRQELINNFTVYLAKARSLMDGGPFAGSYFEDTLTPILANYCTYPEDGGQVRPDFGDPHIFDDVAVSGDGTGSRS